MSSDQIERTLIVLKPDAVQRGIMGEILHRFERAGLKIVGAKLVHPSKELAEKHYFTNEETLRVYGKRTLADCEKFGIDVLKNMGTKDELEIGKMVWQWNFEFLTSGPVFAIVFEGLHAVENCRMLAGSTIPLNAQPGTIRGDFSLDSAIGANARKRTIYNLIHASGTVDEAKREIELWFKPNELYSYKRVHEELYQY